MIMKIVLNNTAKCESFALIFQHVKTFTEYINISFTATGLYIQAMDSSHVSIFEITLPAEWFDEYILGEEGETPGDDPEDESISLGISSLILFKILNSRDKSQKITIDYSNKKSDIVNIHFAGDNKQEFDKHFEVSLIDIEMDIMQIPDMEYQAEITLSSYHFANIINQLKLFGNNLDVECSEDKIILYSSSVESGKMFVEIKIEDLTSFSINEGETVNMSFSLTFLHNICLYNKLSKEIELKFSENVPMKIIYNIIGDEDGAKMVFYLAPKITDSD